MTATEIVMKRTGVAEDEASYYVELAVLRICKFLKVEEIAIQDYLFPVVDIATLLYQMDNSVKNSKSHLGYETNSFSEGGVSVSKKGMTGSDIRSKYDDAINDVLNDLGGIRFL